MEITKKNMDNKTITLLTEKIHLLNKSLGYWDKPNSVDMQICLINSEISEFLEAHREDRKITEYATIQTAKDFLKEKDENYDSFFINFYKNNYKKTMEEELADIFIRLADWIFYLNITRKNIKYINNHFNLKNENIHRLLKIMHREISTYQGYDDKKLTYTMEILIGLADKLNIDLELQVHLKLKYNSINGRNKNRAY